VSSSCRDTAGNTASKSASFKYDATAPTIGTDPDLPVTTFSSSGATVTYIPPGAGDGLSGLASAGCTPAPGTLFPVGLTTVTCTATDTAGNSASSHFNVTVTLLGKASPTLSTTASAGVTVGAAVSDTAALAGGASPTGSITFRLYGPNDATCSSTPVTTSTVSVNGNGSYSSPSFVPASVGTYRWVASYGGDSFNNAAAGSCGDVHESVKVSYGFQGFFSPVNNPPIVNTGKSGKTYPVKFSLVNASGGYISSLSAITDIQYKKVACGTFNGDPTDALEATAAGGTSLRYDTASGQFIYNWQTPSGAGCLALFVTTAEGAIHEADFNLS